MNNLLNSKIIVLSGPSGVGKDSVAAEICKLLPDTALSVSCTTRPPRYKSDGQLEQNGIDYFFIDHTKFLSLDFLETTNYLGEWYGTSFDHIQKLVQAGHKHILLNLDDNGVSQVKASTNALSILILPPSAHELKLRLTQRNSETSVQINNRMQKSFAQLKSIALDCYDYVVINDALADTSKRVIDIINGTASGQSYDYKRALVDRVCTSFLYLFQIEFLL